MAFVESLMMTPGMSDTRAIELCRQQHHFSVGRFRTLKKRVQAAWLVQDEGERPTVRAAAIRRIMSMLFFARGQRNADGRTWERPPNHSAIRGYESLLADLQGTRAPIQVNVNHEISSALTDVIGNLTPEQLQEALDEWNAMEQLANEAKQLRAAE